MKIERKDLEKSVVELIVEVDTKNVAKFRKKAVKHLTENADIKWFRKWHVTEDVVVKHYGEEHIAQLTIDFAIDTVYRDALKEEKILPVAQGEIKEIISQDPLKIRMEVEVFPEIAIEDAYKKISLTKKTVKVTAKEVTAALDDIQTRFTTFKEVEDKKAKLAMGDRATIDTMWVDKDGKDLENTNMQEYPLVLGSGMLVPGFEEGLVWAKSWDELSLPINFPKDYHNADFAGLETTFTVNIKKIEKAVKPEFTPEFIKDLRGKDLDLDWLKALIKEEITDTKESNARMEEESELIEELLKITTLDIGDKMLAEQIKKVYEEIKQNMAGDNIKMTDYLESLKLSEEAYKDTQVKPVALRRLQWELILHKLAELEPKRAAVSDKDMEAEIVKIKSRFENPEVLERLETLYKPENQYYQELKTRLWFRNVIESFFKKA